LGNFLGIFWRIFCGEFFERNFLGGIFWEDFLGGIVWEEFFGRSSLFTLLKSFKLFEYGRN
jgi:hypothetical protein